MRVETKLLNDKEKQEAINLDERNAVRQWTQFTKEMLLDEMTLRMFTYAGFPVPPIVNQGSPNPIVDFVTPFSAEYMAFRRAFGHAVDIDAVRTDKYGVIAKMQDKPMRQAMDTAIEQDMANFFNGGFVSTGIGIPCPDGQALFSAAHPLAVGTASNIIVAGSVTNPPLTYSSLEAALIQAENTPPHVQGAGPQIITGRFKLVVSPANRFRARTLLESMGEPQNDTNAKNVISSGIDLVVSNFITNPAAWFLVHESHKMYMLDKSPRVYTRDDSRLASTNAHFFYLRQAWGRAIGDWRGVLGSTGLGS
jgi:hypothetical protein